MDLPAPLAWLVDEAGASPGPDRFLAELGGRLLAARLPLAGGALMLAVPHPIIARRTWLWRAENGEVILDGPDGVDVKMTPEAAEQTAENLIDEAVRARGQRRMQRNLHRAQ